MTLSARIRRPARSVGAALALLLAPLLLFPAGVRAHAGVASTSPPTDNLIEASPQRVSISVTGTIDGAASTIKVFGPRGTVVSTGRATTEDGRLSVPIMADGNGTYAAAWRLVAADGQPQSGIFEYHLGTRSAAPLARQQAQAALHDDTPVRRGLLAARWALLIATMIAAGGAIFTAIVAPGVPARGLRTALGAVILASLATFLLHAAQVQGVTLTDTLSRSLLEAEATTRYGAVSLLRVGLAFAALAATPWLGRSRPRRLTSLAIFAALAVSMTATGHAAADAAAMPLVASAVHVLAAAAWIGTLVQLAALGPRSLPDAAQVARRYSRLAALSVAMLAAAGAYLATEQTWLSWATITGTDYGKLLLAKAWLFAVLMLLAFTNRVVWLPKIDVSPRAAAMLRCFVRGEVALVSLVLLATAALVQAAPPASLTLPPGKQDIAVTTSPVDLPVTVQPAELDRITIDSQAAGTLEVLDAGGTPYGRVTPDGTHLNLAASGQRPQWELLDEQPQLTYHDYRLPMLVALPETVDARDERRQRVFEWQLPARYDGRPLQLNATVYYTPQLPGPSPTQRDALFVSTLLLIAVASWLTHTRRRRPATIAPTPASGASAHA